VAARFNGRALQSDWQNLSKARRHERASIHQEMGFAAQACLSTMEALAPEGQASAAAVPGKPGRP